MATRSSYPGKIAIRHAVQAARDSGLDVAGIELSADGTIRLEEARALPKPAETLFDKLEAAGKL